LSFKTKNGFYAILFVGNMLFWNFNSSLFTQTAEQIDFLELLTEMIKLITVNA
jgi:hypothetical protein